MTSAASAEAAAAPSSTRELLAYFARLARFGFGEPSRSPVTCSAISSSSVGESPAGLRPSKPIQKEEPLGTLDTAMVAA